MVQALQGNFIGDPGRTNGVSISTIRLSDTEFSVWDFGGQTVFHSTHRFFITNFALYLVLFDMSRPDSIERLKYDYFSFILGRC